MDPPILRVYACYQCTNIVWPDLGIHLAMLCPILTQTKHFAVSVSELQSGCVNWCNSTWANVSVVRRVCW
jgi:hypothetical protein